MPEHDNARLSALLDLARANGLTPKPAPGEDPNDPYVFTIDLPNGQRLILRDAVYGAVTASLVGAGEDDPDLLTRFKVTQKRVRELLNG